MMLYCPLNANQLLDTFILQITNRDSEINKQRTEYEDLEKQFEEKIKQVSIC